MVRRNNHIWAEILLESSALSEIRDLSLAMLKFASPYQVRISLTIEQFASSPLLPAEGIDLAVPTKDEFLAGMPVVAVLSGFCAQAVEQKVA